jgi:hypothetical protein
MDQAVGDVHQRGLAGTILSEQGVDFPGHQREIGPAQRVHGAEPLLDRRQLEGGRGHIPVGWS